MTSVPRSLALDMTPSLMSNLWGAGNMLHEADGSLSPPSRRAVGTTKSRAVHGCSST